MKPIGVLEKKKKQRCVDLVSGFSEQRELVIFTIQSDTHIQLAKKEKNTELKVALIIIAIIISQGCNQFNLS